MLDRNFQLTLQGEANECGVACLHMILNYYGAHYPLSELRQHHHANQVQSLQNLKQLASAYQLNTRALKCDLDDLQNLILPAILHLDFDHFVVLFKVRRQFVVIADPAHGTRRVRRTELNERFTGIALELEPAPDFMQTGNPERFSPFDFIARLPVTHLFSPLLLLLLLSACIQVFALITPFYLQIVVDEALLTNSIDLIPVLTIGFGFVYLISMITQWFRGLVIIYLGTRLSYVLNTWVFNHLLHLPIRFFERRTIGDIISRFGSLKPVQEFISGSAVAILIDGLMAITTFVMLIAYSHSIALTVLVILGIYLLLQYALYFPLKARTHENLVVDAKLQSHFIESTRIINSLKRFDAETLRMSGWQYRLIDSINTQVSVSRIGLIVELSRYLLSGCILLTVVYIAATEIAAALLSVGMLYAIVAYTNHLTNAVLSLTHEWQRFLMLSLHVQRVSDLLDSPTDTRINPVGVTTVDQISFSNVSFGYHSHQQRTIEDISFTLRSGQSLAIMGPSGSGKSTLLQLLMGLEIPSDGEIRFNGMVIKQETRLSPLFSSVLQADQLIAGTLLENITFFSSNPDHDRVSECARLASIHDDIVQLPLGYGEKVSETGAELSTGQQQRILIARAVYRESPVLVLDEGTCHLDSRVELEVIRNLLCLSRACVFVTHRPEVAQLADQVVMLPGAAKTSAAFAAS